MKKSGIAAIALLCMTSMVQAQSIKEAKELSSIPQNMANFSFAPLAEKLLPGVVNISTRHLEQADAEKLDITSSNENIRDYFLQDDGGRTSLGSGFLFDAKGYIVTNNHVIEGADEIVVTLNQNKEYQATIVGTDKMTDLALIKISDKENLPFVKLGNSDNVKVGDWVLVIGNPFGLGGSVAAGIVSAKSRDIDMGSYDNFIQTDASINQGSSGGPMFDMNGEVIGINTAIFSSTGANMGVGFATPINLSKFVIEQLISKGKVERGWIGVKVTTNSDKIVLNDNNTFQGGVVVSSLTPSSPAATAGIEAGDVIIAINGSDIKDLKDFSRRIAETAIGTDVILRVWRNSAIKDLTVKIKQMPVNIDKNAVRKEEKDNSSIQKPEGYIENLGIVLEMRNEDVVVSDVLADSDAYDKGLKAGDIIVKIDGKDVSSIEDAKSYAAYAKTAGGPPMEMNVMSNGMLQTLLLKVE
ncbi:MAG: trypsin-like peptidase domain-containing protein [Alphaproteobacteria bacterium]|nr:trypsin-like peptidase domain-containing protein [Alphaproteobacteria bacterium]